MEELQVIDSTNEFDISEEAVVHNARTVSNEVCLGIGWSSHCSLAYTHQERATRGTVIDMVLYSVSTLQVLAQISINIHVHEICNMGNFGGALA